MRNVTYRDHNGELFEFSPWKMALRALRTLKGSGRYTNFTLRTQVAVLSYSVDNTFYTPACLTFLKNNGGMVQVFYRPEREEWNACVWFARPDGGFEADQFSSFCAGDFDLAEGLDEAGLI